MRFNITPVSAPRQNRSDRWRKRPVVLRYRAYSDALRQACLANDFVLGEEIDLEFYIPMPKSWSNRKKLKMVGEPHRQRPDTDNLAKGVMDSLLHEDCKVWHIQAKKYWSVEGAIVIENIGEIDANY